jgi:uncharacterized protein with NRDE domain
MCTIIIVHNVIPRYPLIIGANRDEFYERPSEGPELIQILPVAVLAPKDLRGGGTWIGAAQGKWFVGLTNQDDCEMLMGKKSRGHVVRDVLLMGDHRQAACYLSKINPHDYNPFNLVFGRPGVLFTCKVHHSAPVELEEVKDGVTIISNDCSGAEKYFRREAAVRDAMSKHALEDIDSVVRALSTALSTHVDSDDPYDSVCVHDDARGFGTKSSSLIAISDDGKTSFLHSEGHACRSEKIVEHKLGPIDQSVQELEDVSDEDLDLPDDGTPSAEGIRVAK